MSVVVNTGKNLPHWVNANFYKINIQGFTLAVVFAFDFYLYGDNLGIVDVVCIKVGIRFNIRNVRFFLYKSIQKTIYVGQLIMT